ncbi:MAG: PIG-L family deacetylase [Candidatus Woesearchaeota archaeon]|nr:PIG-L family deacetylase [Candidatus Woesearchaeota archaeon]
MADEKAPNEKTGLREDTVLVICAHPDDEVFGAGGTIAKYVKEGKRVKTIIFSYGEKSHVWLQRKVTVQMRVKESKKADEILGCSESVFFGLEEGKILLQIKEKKLEKKLKEIVEKEKPYRILTHSSEDPHPDHRAVYKTVFNAVEAAKIDPEIYVFDIWNPIDIKNREMPKMYVDISGTFGTKMRALNIFKSQFISMLFLMPGVVISAFLNGINAECRFAERFYRAR